MQPPAPFPIEGDATEVKPGQLYQIMQPGATGGKALAFWNCSDDMQFKVTVEFQGPDVEPIDATTDGNNAYTTNLYPGECKFAVRGTWKALRKKFSFGPPDKVWQEKQQAKMQELLAADIAAVDKVRAALPRDASDERVAQECIRRGVPFIDPAFPPRQLSVAREWEGSMAVHPWLRPAAYCGDLQPTLFENLIEPNDIDQGAIGSCYLMCALACMAEFPDLVRGIYALPQCPAMSVYRALVCKDGWWRSVVVDDTLPVNVTTMRPVFAKNREELNELWVSLLEKLYAKLHGSYWAMKSGDPAMAIADFLGGPYERMKNRPEWSDPDAMFQYLCECDAVDHLMSLNTPGVDTSTYATGASSASGDVASLAAKYKAVGLVTGHAFSLISVVRTKQGGHRLCKIRNPWGNDEEWNGDWSDDWPLWTPELQREVGFEKADDGTFWMCWDDVVKWFDSGAINYRVGPLKGWSQVRARCTFRNGVPSAIMRLEVAPGDGVVESWFGAQQQDPRGRPPSDQIKSLGVLLTVLQANEAGKMEKISANGPNFMLARDVFASAQLHATGDRPYFVLAQAFQDDARDFVLSSFFSNGSRVTITFVSLDDTPEAQKRCNPATRFIPGNATTPAIVEYQKITPEQPQPAEGRGCAVEWDLAPTLVIPDVYLPSSTGAEAAATAPTAKAPQAVPLAPAVVQQPAPGATGTIRKARDPNAEVRAGFLEKFSTGRNSGGFKSFLPSAMTKNWKRRFFRLRRSGLLQYFAADDATAEPVGEVAMKQEGHRTTLITRASMEHHPNADPNDGFNFIVKFENQVDGSSWMLLLRASTADDRVAWTSKDGLGGVVDVVA